MRCDSLKQQFIAVEQLLAQPATRLLAELLKQAILLLLFVICAIPPALAESKIQNPQSCFRGVFASHASWLEMLSNNGKDFSAERFLQQFPESVFEQKKATLDCVDFTYQVDGLTIEGFYVKPKQAILGALPVVIFNRGGNAGLGKVMFGTKMALIADIAAQGYLVIGSQYRGASARSIANNGNDEFGGRDVNDVLALPALLPEIPEADPTKIALLGWSRGVMQSYLVAKQLLEIRTIISIAGNADERDALKWRPAMERVYTARIPDYEQNKAAELSKRSVVDWLDKLPNRPILLIHGSADKQVNVAQSRLLSARLTERQHQHKLLIYQNDDHSLSKNQQRLLAQIRVWLTAHM